MQNDSIKAEVGDADRLSSRGASIYYLGSAVFAAGIVLIALGSTLIMYYQITYLSEPEKILYTILSIAIGIILIFVSSYAGL